MPKKLEQIQNIGALLMVAIALGVASYKTLLQGSEQAEGAILAVLAAGIGFFLRGRVEAARS